MLAVSPLRSNEDDNQGRGQNMGVVDNFSIGGYDEGGCIDFPDFSDGNLLLESIIDFDDIFIGIDDGDNILPGLEVDPELVAEFSPSGGGEESGTCCSSVSVEKAEECNNAYANNSDDSPKREVPEGKVSSGSNSSSSRGEEIVSNKRDESVVVTPKEGEKGRKTSSSSRHQSKINSNKKPKVKVDWTPDLHRRFVQAVEQLGVEKAVPSRILEIMGIDCLTRHNVASHLQKYRSHRKHLLAHEAEAASWSQRQHLYAHGENKRRPDVFAAPAMVPTTGPWLARPPTIGFPPVVPPHPMRPHFRPLHVWGHPSVDQSLAYIWPKHLPPHCFPSPSHPLPGWAAAVPPWRPHQRATSAQIQGTPCYPQPLQPTRFAAPGLPFAGFPPHAVYKVDHRGFGVPSFPGQSASHPPFDPHPSKESIDAAIGDVITKPWLPLPLGLKPPSLDGVFGELHRQGIPEIPPSCSSPY